MKILWSSNGPWVESGYGRQTKYLCRGIRDLGHEIGIICFFGLEGNELEWEGMPCYPRLADPHGNDANRFWLSKAKPDLFITLYDLWVIDSNTNSWGSKWAPYFPIDHEIIPPPIAAKFGKAWKLLVYSRFAERKVRELGFDCHYLPHAIDTEALYPCTNEEKIAWRKAFYPDWPEDAFIVGMVAANKGWPSRKGFPEAMEAFALLHQNHPEARMYIHSWVGPEQNGPNLQEMCRLYGIADFVRFSNPHRLIAGAYDDAQLRQLIGTFDIFLNPAMGEGFGIPILESQACGIPVVATDATAMTELVGLGSATKPRGFTPTLIMGLMALPDPLAIHHDLEQWYRTPKSDNLKDVARDFALQYSIPNVINGYWKPFLEEIEPLVMGGKLMMVDPLA